MECAHGKVVHTAVSAMGKVNGLSVRQKFHQTSFLTSSFVGFTFLQVGQKTLFVVVLMEFAFQVVESYPP
ncbi:MAG: hypothetical protein B5M56_04760 [Desulfococcus sp. 4484_241]|nr:MAG: hypothetical protein B5M56_04760 [Desulfococcus sp. 4484_241]